MKREGTIGATTFLAIAAVVGVSLQTGPKPAESGGAEANAKAKHSTTLMEKNKALHEREGCTGLKEELEEFLAIEDLVPPAECFDSDAAEHNKPPDGLSDKTSGMKFVIALMPDPVHTHLSSIFDQFTAAIQEGAQDEKYEFDSSWLPWDDEESSHVLLADEKVATLEKEFEENQPGIILFRKSVVCSDGTVQPDCKKEASRSYGEGLVVFVVGEEATHGIHTEQFESALEWIAWLQSKNDTQVKTWPSSAPPSQAHFLPWQTRWSIRGQQGIWT